MKTYEELEEENRLLRRELSRYREEGVREEGLESRTSRSDERLVEANDRYASYESGSYLAFLIGNFRTGFFYRNFRRIYRVFKPTMIVVRVIRWLMIILTMVQASVVLLFFAFLSLFMLPAVFLITLIVSLRVLCERRALRRPIAEAFEGKKVLIFFSSGANSAFFDRNMRTLLPDYTVIVVQEGGNLFGDIYVDEDGKKKRFLTAYRVSGSYYRIRRHYYFYLRKRYFSKASSVSMIY